MIDRNARLTAYHDEYVSFLHPEHLRVERYPLALDYVALPKRKKPRGRESMSLRVLQSEDGANFAKSFRFQMDTPTDVEWNGVRQWTLRSGLTTLRQNAAERVLLAENLATFETWYVWEFLFPIRTVEIYAVINGDGEFVEDERTWRDVIESIELHSTEFIPAGVPKPSPRRLKGKRAENRRLRLKAALETFPETLGYLVPAALDLSDQDPQDLGSGEGDLGVLDQAIAQATQGLPRSEALATVARHRRLLREWIDRHEDRRATYLLPLHSLDGALIGHLMHSGPIPDDDVLRSAGLI